MCFSSLFAQIPTITLAFEMNGITKLFQDIIGLLIKDTLKGTDLTRPFAISTSWLKVFAKMTQRSFSRLIRAHVYLAVTAVTNSVWLYGLLAKEIPMDSLITLA